MLSNILFTSLILLHLLLESKSYIISNFESAKFWDTISGVIHKIPYNNWYKVFEILWGKHEAINSLFNLLISELQKLDFNETIYVGFDAVLRDNGTILDVQRLKDLINKDAGSNVPIVDESNKQIQVKRNVLCALTAEVVLHIQNDENLIKQKKFIEKTDILDFPGARSRKEFDESRTLTNEEISDILLRGKVAYLFNKYSSNFEISNLMVCTNDKQLDVAYLPTLLHSWVEHYVGRTPEERFQSLKNIGRAPLFVIITFFNKQIDFEQNADKDFVSDFHKLDYKWDLRFQKFFETELVTKNFNWHKVWTKSNEGAIKHFSNLYMLRDFKYSKDTFEGFEGQGEEIKAKENRIGYLSALKESFVNYPFVKEHLENPIESWDESTNVNKDGSELIIRDVTPIANNFTRTVRYVNIINDVLLKFKQAINVHYHSGDKDDLIRKAAEESAEIHAYMNRIFGMDGHNFGKFIEQLVVKEKEIYAFFYNLHRDDIMVEKSQTNQYTLYREYSPRLAEVEKFDEKLEILRQDYYKKTKEETIEFFEKMGIDLNELFFGELNNLKNKSDILAEKAQEFWFETKLNIDNYQFFTDLGFDKRLLIKLFDNLKAAFIKLKIVSVITNGIRLYVDRNKRVDMAEEMIAHSTAGIINEFVNSFGWSFYKEEDKKKLEDVKKRQNLNLVIPEDKEIFESLDKESVINLFDFMEKLNENLSKKSIDEKTVKNVPMLKNYRRWRELMRLSFIGMCDIPTYNLEANGKMGDLLKKVDEYSFSIA